MKYVLAVVLVLSLTLSAFAQYVGPFVEGDVKQEPIIVRCVSHKGFNEIIKTKGLKMVMMAENDPVYKTVSYNMQGDVIVANILPDRVCILDILEHAIFSEEILIPNRRSQAQ